MELKYKLGRLEDSLHRRWYYKETKKDDLSFYFPSVTTILSAVDKGEGFHRWLGNSLSYDHAMEYGGKAAQTGSIVHAYIMQLLWGNKIDTKIDFVDEYGESSKPVPVGNAVNKRLMGFIEFIKEYQPEPIANEISLYNPMVRKKQFVYPWAGQVDQVYKIDGKNWMFDVKTGKEYDIHGLQLTAYKLLWDSLFPEEPIQELAALYLPDGWRKKPTFKVKKYSFDPEMWLNVLDLWTWINKNPKPKFKAEFQTEFQITKEYYKKGEE